MERKPLYGNTFTQTTGSTSASRVPIWISKDEMYPGGAYLPMSDTYPEGTVFPAATPITVPKAGGTPVLNGTAPTDGSVFGLTTTEVVMGKDGCTFGIVTRGNLLIERVQSTITSAQQKALAPRFLFTKES